MHGVTSRSRYTTNTIVRAMFRLLAGIAALACAKLVTAHEVVHATFDPAAPAASSTAVRAIDAARFDEGLLWRIERPGVAPSHVFGTLHVSDPHVVRLAPRVERAIAEARIVVTEMALDRATIARARARMTLPPDQSLRAILGEADFARLVADLGRLGYGARYLDRLTPLAALAYLVVRPDPSLGTLDTRIAAAAARRGVPAAGLESAEEQFDALGAIQPEAATVEELRAAVTASERFDRFVAALVSHYRDERAIDVLALVRGGVDAVDRVGLHAVVPAGAGVAGRAFASAPADDPVIDRRNGVMVERMLPMVRGGAAFVAVGAAHLAGKRGVLARLEAAGWRVTRVALTDPDWTRTASTGPWLVDAQ
jgi:uncharacterized protein YbaP (TraB family)